MSKLKELETAYCQELVGFYVCIVKAVDISRSLMIPGINALDIERISSEKCSDRHSSSVRINAPFNSLIRIQVIFRILARFMMPDLMGDLTVNQFRWELPRSGVDAKVLPVKWPDGQRRC